MACLGFQRITSLSSSTALSVLPGATRVWLQAESQGVRFRTDGVAPTASVGMLLSAGADTVLEDSELGNVHLIEVSSGASLNIEYYDSSGER